MLRRGLAALSAAFVIVAIGVTSVAAAPIRYHATLRPASVVSDTGELNQGDPDGFGQMGITLDPTTGDVCFGSNITGTATPTAARVHAGGEGSNGAVVFDLPTPPVGSSPQLCTTVDPSILAPVVADPTQFHVLVTTDEYPDGALRGQLRLLLCGIFAQSGADTVEPTDLLFVNEGDTAVVFGDFAAGAQVLVTAHHGGVLVSTEVHEPALDPETQEARLTVEFEFQDGDDGTWTITAEDPLVGDCRSSAEIHVANSIVPAPSGPGGGGTTPTPPVLPDTAVPRAPAMDAGIAIACAGMVLVAVAARLRERSMMPGRRGRAQRRTTPERSA